MWLLANVVSLALLTIVFCDTWIDSNVEVFPTYSKGDRFDVFWREKDGMIYGSSETGHQLIVSDSFWNGTEWTTVKVAGPATGQPVAVNGRFGKNRIDCFWIGLDNFIYNSYSDNHFDWTTIPVGGNGLVDDRSLQLLTLHKRISLFWHAMSDSIYETQWNGTHWFDTLIGGHGLTHTSVKLLSPSPVEGRIDLFWRDMTQCLHDTWFNGYGWQDKLIGECSIPWL